MKAENRGRRRFFSGIAAIGAATGARSVLAADNPQSRKVQPIANVEDFGAIDLKANPAADSTAAIQKAIAHVQSAGGGIVWFPSLYRVSGITVTATGLVLQGSGRANSGVWIDSGAAGTYAINVIPPLSTQNSFSMRDMGVFGNTRNVTANSARRYSGVQISNIFSGEIRNVFFQGLHNPLRGMSCYGINFDDIIFEQYDIGITGGSDANVSFAENRFSSIRFNDGNSIGTSSHAPGTARAILDVPAMNSNLFENCTFAGTSLAQVDLSHSYGGNTLIACRFERMKAGTTWLKLGSYNKLINCAFYTDGVAIWFDHSQPTAAWAIDIGGSNNVVDGVAPEYWWNVIRLQPGATHNDVRLGANGGKWLAGTIFRPPIVDQGSRNTVRVGSSDLTIDNAYCETTRDCNNFFLQSNSQGAVVTSGLAKAYATVGGVITQAAAQGPFNIGNCFKYTSPGANRRWSQAVAGCTAGNFYSFSFYVWSIGPDQIAEMILGDSLTDRDAYQFVAFKSARWQRVFNVFKAKSASIVVGMRLHPSSPGVVITAPNVTECGAADNDVMVGAYIPTINGKGSVIRRLPCANPMQNPETEGPPDTGTSPPGRFVGNLLPVESTQVIGATQVKYIKTGWRKVTGGNTNVLNTDWLECRMLTGN